ncbi:GNAT family N-acetyltransferase [Neobacillus niacini]|uniref:GNAT family N-acetyltransferase n=1 Tax=Neobacillus niacini TaxID=86668 RepID=UPI001C8E4365|nr:GNAT family N-acetyltransferase [Neobacillus niacini]MBY0148931.1 GNAT family N-acetyltransferase [Neobacillus niacini]
MIVNDIEIIEGSIDDLKSVYQRFTTYFASDELKRYQHFKLLMSKKNYKLLLAKDPIIDEIVGYAFIYEFNQLQAIWLDYMAIDNRFRSSGYGAQLFKELTKWAGGIFIEVEIPEENEGGTRENQLRRITFYERLGAKVLPIPYQLPTNEGGLPMYLYFWQSHDIERPSKEQIQEAITEVFTAIHSDIKHKDDILIKIFSE